MTKKEAMKTVIHEDYLPWALVRDAKELLGLPEEVTEAQRAELVAAIYG